LADTGDEVCVNIVVDDAHLAAFSDVVNRLRAVGLVVESQLAETGVITGRIDAAGVPELEQVQGVQRVEVSRRIELPPPESGLQ
jgi:hypothetical protein